MEEVAQVCPQMSPRERPPGDPGTAPDKRAKDAEEGPSELLPEAKQSLTQSLTLLLLGIQVRKLRLHILLKRFFGQTPNSQDQRGETEWKHVMCTKIYQTNYIFIFASMFIYI